jgi:endonuclease III related protein
MSSVRCAVCAHGSLTIDGIRRLPLRKLEALIRSAGYFRQKARRLKTFVKYLDQQYGGSLSRMLAQSTEKLREELLALNGIGPETADSILLYAGKHPVFVVDAYTRRILDRYGILAQKSKYEEIRQLFARALATVARALAPDSHEKQIVAAPRNSAGASHLPSPMSTAKRSSLVQAYNEMHGLIVGVGKNYCVKSKALCELCPLQSFLVTGRRPVSRNESPRTWGLSSNSAPTRAHQPPHLQRRIRL